MTSNKASKTTKKRTGTVYAADLFCGAGGTSTEPHELAKAMGFPDDYQFTGNREARVKQIGNAVHVNLAKALCKTILESEARK